MNNDKIKAYEELLKVVKKNAEVFDGSHVYLSAAEIKSIVDALKVSERFGIPLDGLQKGEWLQIKGAYDHWTAIGLYGEKHGRTIGWLDSVKQPKSEWLYCINFPCGAYTFGGDVYDRAYPKQTWDAFMNELKAFGAAYSDTANNALYFREDVSKEVYDNFWPIFKKYQALVSPELAEQKKQKLRDELARLESN